MVQVSTSPTITPTKAASRRAVRQFKATGLFQHQGLPALLPVLVKYCETHAIPYMIRARPGKGYEIHRAA